MDILSFAIDFMLECVIIAAKGFVGFMIMSIPAITIILFTARKSNTDPDMYSFNWEEINKRETERLRGEHEDKEGK